MKALEVKNISKIFPDKTKALEDISFSIEQGEFCVIAGSNGSGKSVLMSLIASQKAACFCIPFDILRIDIFGSIFENASRIRKNNSSSKVL